MLGLKPFPAQIRFCILKMHRYMGNILEADVVRERDRYRLALGHVLCGLLQTTAENAAMLSQAKLIVIVIIPKVCRVTHENVNLQSELREQLLLCLLQTWLNWRGIRQNFIFRPDTPNAVQV